ncbi:hypothetical protein OFP71_000460 [Listeria monocytogenes]|nr:hypothetical protein [Listeria monocytogenes]
MFEKITIGIKVQKDNHFEQIDVHFIKDNSIVNDAEYYNQGNDYMNKRDVIIQVKIKEQTFNVDIEFLGYIVDEIDGIRQEFEKAYNEKKSKWSQWMKMRMRTNMTI